MTCEFARAILHGYLDGELDAARTQEFEGHLESCTGCVAALEAQESLRASLRQAQLYERAPASLRRNVLSDLRSAEPTPKPIVSRDTSWRWLAIAAAALLLLYASWHVIPNLRGTDDQATMAAQSVDAHLRSLQPGHLTDVLSTDQHTVKPWFTGKLDFSPPVEDFANDGFPLQGGRLDAVHGRTVAALVYARRKHLISVFVWPTSRMETAPRSGSEQGYHWIEWQKNGMQFCAVSDVSPVDLQELQSLLSK